MKIMATSRVAFILRRFKDESAHFVCVCICIYVQRHFEGQTNKPPVTRTRRELPTRFR